MDHIGLDLCVEHLQWTPNTLICHHDSGPTLRGLHNPLSDQVTHNERVVFLAQVIRVLTLMVQSVCSDTSGVLRPQNLSIPFVKNLTVSFCYRYGKKIHDT